MHRPREEKKRSHKKNREAIFFVAVPQAVGRKNVSPKVKKCIAEREKKKKRPKIELFFFKPKFFWGVSPSQDPLLGQEWINKLAELACCMGLRRESVTFQDIQTRLTSKHLFHAGDPLHSGRLHRAWRRTLLACASKASPLSACWAAGLRNGKPPIPKLYLYQTLETMIFVILDLN